MDITYLGKGGIKLTGKAISVLCDPFEASPKVLGSADVVVWSQIDDIIPSAGMVIDTPGEYEVKGALIQGIPTRLHIDEAGNRGTLYTITIDGVDVVYTGNIAPGLSDAQLEAIGEVDVLVVPVGGHGLTLDATGAASIVSQVEPKYVIPTHYGDDGAKYPVEQEKLEAFLKEMGSNPEPISKLKVSSADLPQETTVVVLSRG